MRGSHRHRILQEEVPRCQESGGGLEDWK